MFFDEPQMFFLRLDDQAHKNYSRNKITYNKQLSKIHGKARQEAKLDYCYSCQKKVSSFCNSHSVPQFCLKRIAVDGKVYYPNTLIDLPFMSSEQGINEAGTFRIICRDCDNKIFQQYEDPTAYQSKPTGQMLAQIAMKNYLQMIYKRLYEQELYRLMGMECGVSTDYIERNHEIISLDLSEYNSSFHRAQIGSLGKHDDWYYLCYYKKLDYTVPIAFQGGIVMVCDFEDNVINDIYNMSPDNHTKEIHVAIFPLEKESVIMLFIDSRDKCYRKFYKQLNKLPLNEQLSAINYIVFSYAENVYISKNIDQSVLTNEGLISACQKSFIAIANYSCVSALNAAIAEFSLSKRNEIPNLLSKKFSLV